MKDFIQRNKAKFAVAVLAVAPMAAHAQETAPVDMTAIGAQIAGYIPGGGTAGLGIFALIMGIIVIKRAFRAGAK